MYFRLMWCYWLYNSSLFLKLADKWPQDDDWIYKKKYGVSVGQNRIGKDLSRVALHCHQRRKSNIARMTNPTPYRANYFRHKLHLDQNEKLEMYGVTRVAAIDCHSRFVVAGATMSRKNNIKIYQDVHRYC